MGQQGHLPLLSGALQVRAETRRGTGEETSGGGSGKEEEGRGEETEDRARTRGFGRRGRGRVHTPFPRYSALQT